MSDPDSSVPFGEAGNPTEDEQYWSDRLADRARIEAAMAVYTRCADLNRPAGQAAVFIADCRVSYHPGVWIEGRDVLARTLAASLARFQRTSHHLGNVEIEFDGPDSATAESTVIAWHRRNDGSEWTLFGRYVDRWVRQGGDWLMACRELRAAGATGRDDSELPPLGRHTSEAPTAPPVPESGSATESAAAGFPVAASDITPQWLTAALVAGGALRADQAVAQVAAQPIGGGAGFMGDVARIRLSYTGEPGPTTFVVKSAAPDPAVREMVRGFRNYEREVAFFDSVAAGLGDWVPRSFAVAIDRPSNHFVLVLEDLSDRYRDGDQVAGASLQQAYDCLDAQVSLHARFWGARSRPDLAWVPRVDGEFFVPTMAGAFGTGWSGVLQRFPDLVPAPLLDLGSDFALHVAGLCHRLAGAPQTLVHSDFRLDNVMFARDGVAPAVKVLDWQGLLVSAGVHDVAFLLSQNLADGVRESSERDLLEHYHLGLARAGVDYAFEALWQDYRVAVLLEWVYAVVIGGSLPMTSPRSRELFAAMVRRSGEAIVSLAALDLLPSVPEGGPR